MGVLITILSGNAAQEKGTGHAGHALVDCLAAST